MTQPPYTAEQISEAIEDEKRYLQSADLSEIDHSEIVLFALAFTHKMLSEPTDHMYSAFLLSWNLSGEDYDQAHKSMVAQAMTEVLNQQETE